MSIPIGFTRKELLAIKRELVKNQTIVCLDEASFLKANLAGLHFASRGVAVLAKIVRKET